MWGPLAYSTLILVFIYCAKLITTIFENKRWSKWKHSTNTFNILCKLCIAITSIYIIIFEYLTLNNIFSYKSIFENSSRALPLMYKITVLWASKGGSILLWLWLFYIFIYLSKPSTFESKIFTELIELPLISILVIENPFNKLNFIPKYGLGMNILLQTPEMVLHPPFLFAGYAATLMPAIVIIDTMFSKNNRYYEEQIYSRIAWIFLTLGIFWGSLWSYKVLGWGGFWGWDPVENSSLVPWLFLSAGMHLPKRHVSKRFISYYLSIISSLLGTMVTRSGVLSQISNHAWWAKISLPIIIAVLTTCILSGIYSIIVVKRYQRNKDERYKKDEMKTKITKMSANIFYYVTYISFIYSAIVILLGIYTPIISKYIANQPINLSGKFYTTALKPAGAVIFITLPLCLNIKPFNSKINKRIVGTTVISVIIAVLVYAITESYDCSLSAAISAFAIILLVLKLNNLKSFPTLIAHIGLTLIFVSSIFAWSLQISQPIMLIKHQPAEIGYNEYIVYNGNTVKIDKKQGIVEYTFNLTYINGKNKFNLYPKMKLKLEMVFNKITVQSFAATPAIKTELYKDIWVVPDVAVYSSVYYNYGIKTLFKYLSDSNYLWIKYCEFPLVPELWLGCWIATFGAVIDTIILAMAKRRKNLKE